MTHARCGGGGDGGASQTETYTIAVDQVQVEGTNGGQLTIRAAEVRATP